MGRADVSPAAFRQKSFYMKCVAIFICGFLVGCGPPPTGKGTSAPDVALKLIQAPQNAIKSWKELKGDVVVLEFWGTWCDPCVDSIPHWNKIVESFKNKPVRFISISDESEAVVAGFLKNHPVSGWIGLDGGKAFSAFNPTSPVNAKKC